MFKGRTNNVIEAVCMYGGNWSAEVPHFSKKVQEAANRDIHWKTDLQLNFWNDWFVALSWSEHRIYSPAGRFLREWVGWWAGSSFSISYLRKSYSHSQAGSTRENGSDGEREWWEWWENGSDGERGAGGGVAGGASQSTRVNRPEMRCGSTAAVNTQPNLNWMSSTDKDTINCQGQ